MIRGLESILIGSQDAKRLADFYRKKAGLKLTMEAEIGEKGESVYGFESKGRSGIYIVDHSKAKGRNKNPERVIFNLEVDNIEKEVKRLGRAKVKKIQDIYHVENYGLIATFQDIDGNYFQLVQIRPS